MKNKINSYCLNSFLTFRYVVDKDIEWVEGYKPWWPHVNLSKQVDVKDEHEIIAYIKSELSHLNIDTGILLSGGIDSAILAAFMPKGTHAFTIRFNAEGAIDESIWASKYADFLGLNLHIIDVDWNDYLSYSNELMLHKKSPLHAIEVAIFKASKVAKNMGINKLVVGNGADSTFGGMDKLLSKDWKFQEFVERYTYVDAKKILTEVIDMNHIYSLYKHNDGVDVQRFLKIVHGEGIIQTFCNAAETAGIQLIEPYESLNYPYPLNIQKIRNGESKYLLRSIFSKLYPHISIVPEKIPFARPMNLWLKDWKGPKHETFLKDIDTSKFSGDQKWLIYNLEQFINLIL